MSYLIYDNTPSYTYGIMISGEGTFDAPERDRSYISIPGRNGQFVIDNGRYTPITVIYPAFVMDNLMANDAAIRAWLLGPKDFVRIEDSYHPEEYRRGIYTGGVNFSPTAWNQHAEFKMSFRCDPRRFLKSGETVVAMEKDGSIVNPTGFDALPLIQVAGSGVGTLTIGGTMIALKDLSGHITIDSEIQDAYYGAQNLNSCMTGDFPSLGPGSSTVTWSGGITDVSITPRWWQI